MKQLLWPFSCESFEIPSASSFTHRLFYFSREKAVASFFSSNFIKIVFVYPPTFILWRKIPLYYEIFLIYDVFASFSAFRRYYYNCYYFFFFFSPSLTNCVNCDLTLFFFIPALRDIRSNKNIFTSRNGKLWRGK